MFQLHSESPSKTVPDVYITYKRKRGVSGGGSSLPSGLQDGAIALISPKKEVEGSIVDTGTSAVGEGFVRNFVNQDTAPPPKHFQILRPVPTVLNVYVRKRKSKSARLIGDVGALAVKEVQVKNFINQDPPPSPKHLTSVGIPPSPTVCKEIEQVGLNSPLPLQVDASALIAPKEAEASVAMVEDGGDGEVSDKQLSMRKNRDIGWNHGVPVGGNNMSWKCKWCGVVRWGGVYRLKQHLAGAKHIRKCPEVPEHVAETMRKHLNPGVSNAIDAMNSRSLRADGSCSDTSRQFSQGNKRLKIGEKLSGTIAQPSKMAAVQASEETPEDEFDSPDGHWRKALEHMLQLPDVKGGGGGGIKSCIHNALRSGPSVCTTKSKLVHISGDATDPKDQFKDKYKVQDQSQRVGSSAGGASDISKSGQCGHADVNNTSLKYQNVLSKILSSNGFVSLCDFIYGTFRDKNASEMLDFSLINTRMINGNYDRSPDLFDKDIEQVRERIRKVGQETMLIASNLPNISPASSFLPNISPASSQKEVADDMIHEVGEQIFEGAGQAGGGQRNSMASNTAQYESDRSTMPEPTEASCLYKICTCKQCGTDADIKHCLICDGCEAMYHLSCIVPAQKEIPMQSWYCAACAMNRKEPYAPSTSSRGTSVPITNIGETSEPVLTSTQPEGLHPNCTVCDRLEVSEAPRESTEISNTNVIVIDNTDSSDSSHQSYELPEPSGTAKSHLCKKCGTCEDDDRQFLTCAHTHCPYKFYHIRCLKYSQTALLQKKNHSCWYCPSCLCRSCLSDKDDSQLVLCDTCDEGYHIYCMTPPLDSIPRGKWHCLSCTASMAREGMRRYEHMILQQHGRKDARQSNEAHRSTDLLLSTVGKDSLVYHIRFLENKANAGISHHSLRYSKTGTIPCVQVDDTSHRAGPICIQTKKNCHVLLELYQMENKTVQN